MGGTHLFLTTFLPFSPISPSLHHSGLISTTKRLGGSSAGPVHTSGTSTDSLINTEKHKVVQWMTKGGRGKWGDTKGREGRENRAVMEAGVYRENSKRVVIVYLCLVSASGTLSWGRVNRRGFVLIGEELFTAG